MNRLVVDWDRCEGHGLCVDAAPRVLSLRPDGDLVVQGDGVVEGAEECAAEEAVKVCPVGALELAGHSTAEGGRDRRGHD